MGQHSEIGIVERKPICIARSTERCRGMAPSVARCTADKHGGVGLVGGHAQIETQCIKGESAF